MKVVFLDFDGVLNTLKDPDTSKVDLDIVTFGSVRWLSEQLSPMRIGYLNTLLEATGANVVLSTSWRQVHSQRSLEEAMQLRGFTGFVLGSTPTLSSAKMGFKVHGHHEIQAWVSAAGLDIKDYIILDDISAMGPLKSRLVHCKNGLTERMLPRAIRLLVKS